LSFSIVAAVPFAMHAEETATPKAAEQSAKQSNAGTDAKKAMPSNAPPVKEFQASPVTRKAEADAFTKLPDSHAQEALKKLSKDEINAPREKRFSLAEQQLEAQRIERGLDVIEVIGQRDPEDISKRKLPPMLAFRARLDADKPLTPAQIAKGALCLIGLCANYGPDGLPPEPTREDKSEARKNRSTTELSQVRGTYQ
jgi:hypothetical protein